MKPAKHGWSAQVILLAILIISAADPAGAQPTIPICEQVWPVTVPTDFDRSRVETFTLGGFKVNVLLPVGYGQGSQRYPVLYVLPGAGWSSNVAPDLYLAYTDVQELDDEASGVIVVMTFGGLIGFYTDWVGGTQSWESYHVGTLIPYVDAHYRTIADGTHRALAGESMGGFGAMHYAARHPDLFVAAASFLGHLDLTLGLSPVGETFWLSVFDLDLVCPDGDPRGPWGDPFTNDVQWRNHSPTELIGNLGALSLYVSVGNGVPCDARDLDDYPALYPAFVEPPARVGTVNFSAAATSAGIPHTAEIRDCGVHSFRYVNQGLHHFWPQMMHAFASPPNAPPDVPFDFRSADPVFSVWGWSFEADSARAAEFLSVADASCVGVGLGGSGTTAVTTARASRLVLPSR